MKSFQNKKSSNLKKTHTCTLNVLWISLNMNYMSRKNFKGELGSIHSKIFKCWVWVIGVWRFIVLILSTLVYVWLFLKIKNRKNICQAPVPVPGKGRLPPLRMATLYILVGWWGITHTSSAATGIAWDHAWQIQHLKLVFSALQLQKVKQIAWLRWGYMSLPNTLPGTSAWESCRSHIHSAAATAKPQGSQRGQRRSHVNTV